MAFKAFGHEGITTDNSLPFAEAYLKANPSMLNACWDLRKVSLTAKGMMFVCDDWKAFVWKSTDTYKHIHAYLLAWQGTKQKTQVMQAMLVECKPYIVLGVEETRHAYWSSPSNDAWTQAYATAQDNPNADMHTRNPFPMPASSTPDISLHASSAYDAASLEPIATTTTELSDLPLEDPARALNGKKRTKVSKSE